MIEDFFLHTLAGQLITIFGSLCLGPLAVGGLIILFLNWNPPDPESTRDAREASYIMAILGSLNKRK